VLREEEYHLASGWKALVKAFVPRTKREISVHSVTAPQVCKSLERRRSKRGEKGERRSHVTRIIFEFEIM